MKRNLLVHERTTFKVHKAPLRTLSVRENPYNKKYMLDELFFSILSGQTNGELFKPTLNQLKNAYSDWSSLLDTNLNRIV